MDYLDYLADYTYDELPAAVRSTISREDYTERRRMVLAVQEPDEVALPPVLAAAFAAHSGAQTQVQKPQPGAPRQSPKGKGKKSNVRWLPWLAAAGWLLFLGVSGMLLLREPGTLLVETSPSGTAPLARMGDIAPAPAAPTELAEVPDTLYATDTLYQTVIRYLDRVEMVYDTVFERVPYEQLVYVRDTVYLHPPNQNILVSGSSNLNGKQKVLQFLFATE